MLNASTIISARVNEGPNVMLVIHENILAEVLLLRLIRLQVLQ